MGFFDSLKNSFKSSANNAVNNAANRTANNIASGVVNGVANGITNGIGKGKNESVTFTFDKFPTSLSELQALPEASLDTPFKTTALCLLTLFNFSNNIDAMYEMLEFLNGPDDVSAYAKQFIRDRLKGKEYTVASFFAGATVENNYTPSNPYQITVSTTPYSFDEENWATMYVKSSGADSPRPVKLRKKPSTGQWFFTEIQCLGDIRVPVAADPWA